MKTKKFPFYRQPDSKDCGPTCIRIVSKYYGKPIALEKARSLTETQRAGSNLMGLSEAAEAIGFKTLGVKISLQKLIQAPLPCILHWKKKFQLCTNGVLIKILNLPLQFLSMAINYQKNTVYKIYLKSLCEEIKIHVWT